MVKYQEPSDEEVIAILSDGSTSAEEKVKRAYLLGWQSRAKAINPELARVIKGLQKQDDNIKT
jgi:hypothetical protein